MGAEVRSDERKETCSEADAVIQERDDSDLTTKCNVISWIASGNRKRTLSKN